MKESMHDLISMVHSLLRRILWIVKGPFVHFYEDHPEVLLDWRVNQYLTKKMNTRNHNGKTFIDDINVNCRQFLSDEQLNDEVFMGAMKKDLMRAYLLYGITPDEYFLHDFMNCSEGYKGSILSRKHKDDVCCRKLGKHTHIAFDQLKDKWLFYQLAEPFFKRDVCLVDKDNIQQMQNFLTKHSSFIVKPRRSSSGMGVHVVNVEDFGSEEELINRYLSDNVSDWLFEEKIIQSQTMADWHPSSVNTIRVPSIRTKKGCVVILPLFRTGKNGNVVDNCHNDGGLMAVPNAQTGVLESDGYDVFTNIVEKHPNSGITFKGWQVPRWQELLETVEALHMSLPKYHKYVGFDFALTDKGWVVVEGNWGNFPHQVCVKKGIRKEFEKLMNS